MTDRHEEIARCLFREANDALFLFDPAGHRVLDVNPAALRLTGYERKAVLRLKVWDLFSSPDPAVLEQLIEAYQISWFYHSREGLTLNRAEGEPIPVNVSVSRIHTKPETLGLVVVRDISERKQAQDALDRFFRLAPDLFAILKDEGDRIRFVRVNAAWQASLGYRPEELAALSIRELVHPDDRPASRAALEGLEAGRELTGLEYRLRHRDGSYRWVALNLIRADGQIYAVGRDVTEEKRLTALRRAMERAESASRAKSELLADLGHEVRNPASAILEYAEKLVRAEAGAPSERLDDLRTIRRNARYLLRLLGDLLDLSKLEAGTLRVERGDCQVGRVLAEVVDLFKARAADRGLELSVAYRTPIPASIRCDPMRLRQILINLVNNAIKFTPSGSVRVEAALDESTPDAPSLIVEVVDTGVGMTPEVVSRLFTPFFRAAGSGVEGAGLGLAISHRLAGLLGGRIEVRSQPGVGSRFVLVVPTGPIGPDRRTEPPPAGLDTDEWATLRPAVAPVAQAPASPSPSPLRILLADDNRDLRAALAARLRRGGADVLAVEDGRRAVEEADRAAIANRPYDLVILDVRMPGMDGLEAARLLRGRDRRSPLMALSASDEWSEAEAGLFDAVAMKPIDWDGLRSLIGQLVGQGRPALDSGRVERVQ